MSELFKNFNKFLKRKKKRALKENDNIVSVMILSQNIPLEHPRVFLSNCVCYACVCVRLCLLKWNLLFEN